MRGMKSCKYIFDLKKGYSVHLNVHTPLQIVFLTIFKIEGHLSKMKPFTMRGPEIGKKNTREM